MFGMTRKQFDEWWAENFGTYHVATSDSGYARHEKSLAVAALAEAVGLTGWVDRTFGSPGKWTGRNLIAELDALTERLAAVECASFGHVFGDIEKGCLDSLFCTRCKALNPAWEIVPDTELTKTVGSFLSWWPSYYCEDPKAQKVDGVWYRPVKTVAKKRK